jgi:hypothetical protein
MTFSAAVSVYFYSILRAKEDKALILATICNREKKTYMQRVNGTAVSCCFATRPPLQVAAKQRFKAATVRFFPAERSPAF